MDIVMTAVVFDSIYIFEFDPSLFAQNGCCRQISQYVFCPNIDLLLFIAGFGNINAPIKIARYSAVSESFVNIALCERDGIFAPIRMCIQRVAQFLFQF